MKSKNDILLFIIIAVIVSGCDSCKQPVAAFSVSTTTALTGQAVAFTNTSQYAKSYSWDFGDNTYSTDFSPSHIYISPGTYNVKLKATNSNGSNEAPLQSINVSNPSGSISGSITPKDAAVAVVYTMASAGVQGVLSNPNGSFTIQNVAIGNYSISVIPKIGYNQPSNVQVSVTNANTANAGVFNLQSNGQTASAKFIMDATNYSFNYPQTACLYSSPNFSISGTTPTSPSYWFFIINLTNVNGPGSYNVTSAGAFVQATHYTSNGVSDGNWTTNNGGTATITITNLDNIARLVSGTFTATLIAQGATTGGNKQITSGTFNFNF